MEVLGRFQYHVIGGATGCGKGKLLDCLTAQGAQVLAPFPLLPAILPLSRPLLLQTSHICFDVATAMCSGSWLCWQIIHRGRDPQHRNNAATANHCMCHVIQHVDSVGFMQVAGQAVSL